MQDLRSTLFSAATAWCAAHDAPDSRLGKAVAGDANFFERARGRDTLPCTVSTLEKFASFLTDPANWPEGRVGEEALSLGHVTGVSAATVAASAGQGEEISPSTGKAAA